ncbi:MAG: acyltransferase [Bacteroidales bacterium]|nr:acyltransferase [Bacteroidales bacterium]
MAETDPNNEFAGIAPYTDAEAAEAMNRLAKHRYTRLISKYLFPKERRDYLSIQLKEIHTVDDFQQSVVSKAVAWVIETTSDGFTYDGVENIKALPGRYLAMSNHRDIVLDPALTQYVLFQNGLPQTEIAVGDNLIKDSKTVEALLRCNRMVTVVRGVSARELYLSSQVLSKYIRQGITSGRASMWIAQRQGRTKNGIDITEQGLLKMFDMSGTKGFKENFEELNIVPMSISYEYEPCDVRKAREVLISRTQKYVKKRNEDMHSIIMGIRQQKGHIHLHIGKPLTSEEIAAASLCDKNDRYQWIRHAVDRRVIEGYKLWKTNYLCYDLVYGTDKYAAYYTPEDVTAFKKYMEHRLNKVERSLDRNELRDIFLKIYSNPVLSKEQLAAEEE